MGDDEDEYGDEAVRFDWFTVVLVGASIAHSVSEMAHSITHELHEDLIRHYNWRRLRRGFEEAVGEDIRRLP